jgi:hypothetical protein
MRRRAHDLVQVDDLGIEDLLPAEREQIARERSRALDGVARLVQDRLALGRVDVAAPELLRAARHHREPVVEVVRDAAGEPPDRVELLRLAQPLLERVTLRSRATPLGHVVDHGEGEDLALELQERDRDDDVPGAAVRLRVLVLVVADLFVLGERFAQPNVILHRGLRRQPRDVRPHDRAPLEAPHLEVGAVHLQHGQGRERREDETDGAELEGLREARLGRLHRLDRLALGGVIVREPVPDDAPVGLAQGQRAEGDPAELAPDAHAHLDREQAHLFLGHVHRRAHALHVDGVDRVDDGLQRLGQDLARVSQQRLDPEAGVRDGRGPVRSAPEREQDARRGANDLREALLFFAQPLFDRLHRRAVAEGGDLEAVVDGVAVGVDRAAARREDVVEAPVRELRAAAAQHELGLAVRAPNHPPVEQQRGRRKEPEDLHEQRARSGCRDRRRAHAHHEPIMMHAPRQG